MKEYFAQLFEYVGRCTQRLDFLVGISLGIIFLLIALLFGLGASATVPITIGIIILAALEAGYFVYREERIMRAEREAKIRLTASPASFSWNRPDPGRGKVRLEAHVRWEIWTDVDINTAEIGLNIVGIRHKKWWQIFQRKQTALIGLPPKGQDTFRYRRSFRAIDPQPIEGDAEFEYEGPLDWPDNGDCDLELVLVTGSPAGRYSARVAPRLWGRGTRRPL